MANIKSAQKRIRSSKRRTIRNKVARTRARSAVRDARLAIGAGDASQTEQSVRIAASALDKAAEKGIIHKRNAARRKSRLMKAAAKAKAAQK